MVHPLNHGASILRVAVNHSVTRTFDYTASPDLDFQAQIGCRVRVPFGKQKAIGYILEKRTHAGQKDLKSIFNVLDPEPLFPPQLVPFLEWMAEYYRYPIGRLLQSALPGGLNAVSFKAARLTPKGLDVLAMLPPHTAEHKTLLWVKNHPGRPWPRSLPGGQALEKKGWIVLEEKEKKGRAGPLLETVVRVKTGQDLPALLAALKKRTENESEFLEKIFQGQGLPVSELKSRFKNVPYLLNKWSKKGILERCQAPLVRDLAGKATFPSPVPDRLFRQQQEVLATVEKNLDREAFAVFLVHGVTGSGKTEVYYRAIEHARRHGRQSILLVPEIALAVYMEGLFRSRLGERVAVYHSALSERERFQQWIKAARGEVDLVIGARSALFAPFPDLGLIIVDEEHEFAYKQEEAPRYQARDAAIMRAKLQNVPVLLGSGTPAVQSFHHALTRHYQLLSMPERVENRPLPEVSIIDMKSQVLPSGGSGLISAPLKEGLSRTLAEGCQAIFFLNRRGFNRVHLCRSCGRTLRCPNCDLALIHHLKQNRLACHYCGFQMPPPTSCPHCGHPNLKTFGFGTEKLENELQSLFPQARIARLDRDSVRGKDETFRLLKEFSEQKIDLLVGTQMITKGYDFPHVTLVGVIAADFSLAFPDFRAGERTFQLLAQVAGRAGRGVKPGRVIIQTFNPEHYAVLAAKNHDYRTFYLDEIKLRKQLHYPPFAWLACLRLQGRDKEQTMHAAHALGRDLERLLESWPVKTKELQILGPVAAPLSRLQGKYRWQILLKSKGSAFLHHFLEKGEELAKPLLHAKGVSLSIDVDPYNML